MEGDLADTSLFAAPAAELEEGTALTPKFDANGLIAAVATDAKSGDVLMVAHMNGEALAKSLPAARPGISAARVTRFGKRVRPPATRSTWSKCASTAIRTPFGSKSSRSRALAIPDGVHASIAPCRSERRRANYARQSSNSATRAFSIRKRCTRKALITRRVG